MMDKIMDNAQKQQQVTDYTTTLANIVLKMEQNETDAGNDVEMTTPPYIVRQELTLIRRQVSIFSAAELPALTRIQQEAKPTIIGDEYNIAGVSISKGEGQTLTVLRWELEDALQSALERFNQHLINLRPKYYPHIPTAIEAV